ncbi:TPA: hypothetical protein NID16_005250 [Pseudomonas aeruginosa]|nr:hypothetical protein [Pseudomonas aeruginosa]
MNIKLIPMILLPMCALCSCAAVQPSVVGQPQPGYEQQATVPRPAPHLAPNCAVIAGVHRCLWVEPAGFTRTLML